MTTQYGWNNCRLMIDLTNKKIEKDSIPESWLRSFLGGRGLNSRTLFEMIEPGIDPLGPKNVLIFGVGPVTGTLIPSSARSTITALAALPLVDKGKSPCFGDSNAGGSFGTQLKYAGYDQLIIRGAADKPVYLWIDDDKIEIRDAEHLWGLSTSQTTEQIRKENGDEEIDVAAIGPAGENKVRMAAILNNGDRAWAKTGMGAVMGSKKLKAVAVRGSGQVRVAEPQELQEVVKKAIDTLYQDPSCVAYSVEGTPTLVEAHQLHGRMGTKNFQYTQFDDWKKVNAEALSKYWTGSKACVSCPLHCSHHYRINSGPYAGVHGDGPEYVTVASYGPKCGNSNLESILKGNSLSNDLGIDTLNTGSAIAWAMECWQKGIMDAEFTQGIELEWGDHKVILDLIKRIAYREGRLGDLLAEGAYRASKEVGKGSDKLVIHAKAQDPALSDPRAAKAWGLGYAVASRGGCHLRALPSTETFFTPEEAKEMFGTEEAVQRYGIKGKGRLVKWSEDQRAVADSLEVCKFNVRTILSYPKWMRRFFNAVTGQDLVEEELMEVGERIINVERAFNVRQGLTRGDDSLSERFLKEPIPTGPAKGEVLDLEPLLDEYYKARGWDVETGLPTKSLLKGKGLGDVAVELEKIGKLK